MRVANDAFRDKSALQVGPIGSLILDEYVEVNAMRRQIVETGLQDRAQQERSDAAAGIFDRYSPEPN